MVIFFCSVPGSSPSRMYLSFSSLRSNLGAHIARELALSEMRWSSLKVSLKRSKNGRTSRRVGPRDAMRGKNRDIFGVEDYRLTAVNLRVDCFEVQDLL